MILNFTPHWKVLESRNLRHSAPLEMAFPIVSSPQSQTFSVSGRKPWTIVRRFENVSDSVRTNNEQMCILMYYKDNGQELQPIKEHYGS